MLLLYNIGIRLYYLLVRLFAPFNTKAKNWVNGRKEQKVSDFSKSIWFHFASLGEFEQGRPVLEAVKEHFPDNKIIITFFSPSGYEIRKNTPLADAVYYLPLDTPDNARVFIDTIKPAMAIFTKYEYWYHYYRELNKRQVPLYVISAIFRPGQVFFKWYGGLHRKILSFVTHFFVQDEKSEQLLKNIGIQNVTISGDTRFDRVWVNAQQPKELPIIRDFKDNQKVFIAGSSWPPDEELISALVKQYHDWKFIFAPHEISEEKINKLVSQLPAEGIVRFSQINNLNKPLASYRILIIDNIGMLSSLYQYADVAYIGGGFGVGIHNTLEAAAFGIPVIFGPNYSKFNEALQLVGLEAGFSINNQDELNSIVQRLISDTIFRSLAGQKAGNYVTTHTGASQTILQFIKTNNKL